MTAKRKSVPVCLSSALLLLGCAGLRADVVYTYVGNQFNDLRNGATCPPTCNVSGSFVVAEPLPANLPPLTPISPISFSLSSGTTTLTDGLPAYSELAVGTDAAGKIDQWSWVEVGPVSDPTARILTENSSSFQGGIVSDDVRFGHNPPPFVGPIAGLIQNDPGIWSMTSVPEPAALALMALALTGLTTLRKRPRS